MPEFDDERRARWSMEPDSDGWRWWTPHWDRRVSTDSSLAMTLEALRRAVDLRESCAQAEGRKLNGELVETGIDKGLTLRVLVLVDLLNRLLERVVVERAEALGVTIDPPHGLLADIARELSEAGILTADEYRPSD
jgi:hypothetical protein